MARYIDAEQMKIDIRIAMAKQLCKDPFNTIPTQLAELLCQFADDTPTADVVEVCRCHECKYGDNGIQKQEVYTVCNRFGNGILKMSPLDFCSYGERRTDNDV